MDQQQIIGLEGGQPLGEDFSGDTLAGTSTGHHLHFEIRLNADAGSHVDPYDYLFVMPDMLDIEKEGGNIDNGLPLK